VPVVTSALDGGVDHAAAEPAIGGIIGVGHHLELLYGLDVGSHLPGAAGVADGRTVE